MSIYNTNTTEQFVVKSSLPVTEIPNTDFVSYYRKCIDSLEDDDWIALIDAEDGRKVSWKQADVMIQHFASGLLQLGICKSDLILFYGENCIDYCIGLLATAYLGCSFSPVNTGNGVFELTRQIVNSKGSVLVIGKEKKNTVLQALNDTKYRSAIKNLKMLIVMQVNEPDVELVNHPSSPPIIRSFDQILQNGQLLKQIPYFPTKPDDHMMIVYTSGTTGLPKGAVHTQRSVIGSMINLKQNIPIPNIVISLWYPMGHISGSLSILCNTISGFTSILHNHTNTKRLMKACEKYRIIVFPISPSIAVDLAKEDFTKQYDLSSIKFMSFAGAKIPENILEKIEKNYSVHIIERYGSTEFMGSVDNYDFGTSLSKKGNVGFPLNQVEMKIIDLHTGNNLPANQDGEICFRGPPRFARYLNNEKATNETIDEYGWYHTGDVGHYDEYGALFIVDRIKELIKFKHYSVAPAEIEDFLCRHPAVLGACVVGVKHVSGNQLVRAYVHVSDINLVTEQELVDYVKESMGIQKQLRGGVRFVDQIHRTPIGKINRNYYKNLIKDEVLDGPID